MTSASIALMLRLSKSCSLSLVPVVLEECYMVLAVPGCKCTYMDESHCIFVNRAAPRSMNACRFRVIYYFCHLCLLFANFFSTNDNHVPSVRISPFLGSVVILGILLFEWSGAHLFSGATAHKDDL